MRTISRLADASINTVSKPLIDAGLVCDRFHDETARNVTTRRVECDKIWLFCCAEQKNVQPSRIMLYCVSLM